MKTLRYLLISFSWLPILALAAWWAGFMPFPTRPEELGWKAQSIDGMKTGKDYHFLISAREAKEKAKTSLYGLGQWYCETDNKDFCYLYEVVEEPFYGWTNPRWVLTVNNLKGGAIAMALYGTYAACKWNEERRQKASEGDRVNYERWATEQHQKVESQDYEFYSCVRTP